MCCALLLARCVLFVVWRVSVDVRCLLFVACCLNVLHGGRCLCALFVFGCFVCGLRVVVYSLFVACCLLLAAHCLLLVVC